MKIELLDYQVIALIAGVFVLSVYAYSVGLREGKRIGFHRGRAISFNQYKEEHKWFAALTWEFGVITAKTNGAN